jgi:hypothetical protein
VFILRIFWYAHLKCRSRDSSVGIVTAYMLDGRGVGVQVPVGASFFCSPRCLDRFWGPIQLPIQWVVGALSPWVKRLGHEADHSTPN